MASATRATWIVGIVLALHAALLAWSAWRHSPTVDEVAYLPAGVWHWTTGRFGLARVSPPLARLVATAPLVALESPATNWARVDTSPGRRTEHDAGRDFLTANGSQSFAYFTIARWSCIPFSLLGGWICYRWASALYGAVSGVLAAVIWCFSPNLIAHGALVTPDMAVTAFGIAATYAFWRWLRQGGWRRTAAMGLLLGLCQLSKTSGVLIAAVWPALWLVDRWPIYRPSSLKNRAIEGAQLLLAFSLALAVLNAGYLFQGTLTPLGRFEFVSAFGAGPRTQLDGESHAGNRWAESWIGRLWVPLPKDYVLGVDLQKKAFETRLRSYLGGTYIQGGWWYYYLYGLAVKVPLGSWLLVALAVGVTCFFQTCRAPWRDEMCLLVPLFAVLGFVSSQTGFNHHLRYVLPIAPFAIVWASKVGRACQQGHKVVTVLASMAVGWMVSSSLYVYPHSLSYFNELAGGPRNGHAHLINSNIDWGQDLLYLRAWLDRHPQARPLGLAYYGECNPELAGIEFSLPPRGIATDDEVGSVGDPPPGWYAVSVNYLRGHEFAVIDRGGQRRKIKEPAFTYFRRISPVAMAGYSIYVYHVRDCDVARLQGAIP